MAEASDSSKNRKPSKLKYKSLKWIAKFVLKLGPRLYAIYVGLKRLIELLQEYLD